MAKFTPKGPKRYPHQRRGLLKMIETKGVTALLFDPGCLSGDTVVTVNRAGKSFRLTLRDLEYRFNGGVVSGGHSWSTEIPTRIQRNVDGRVRLADVVRVSEAGVQRTFTVTLEDGRSIRATADHPLETPLGMVAVGALLPGAEVYVNVGRGVAGRTNKPIYRERAGLRYHPHARRRQARTSPYQVAEHRLVVEADMNGLSLADYINRLRQGVALAGLQFLDPEVHVHHLDLNPQHNELRNLRVMTATAHHRLHADLGKTRSVLENVATVKVASVERYGDEMTYDVTVADDPHTFIAAGFSVGNTGKTMTVLDYCSLLALKAQPDETGAREVRVLVVAPLAAVDTWIDQAERFVTDDVQLWAEALGSDMSIRQRAEALASRGNRPFKNTLEAVAAKKAIKKAHPDWKMEQVATEVDRRIARKHGARGTHFQKSLMISSRSTREGAREADGPGMLGSDVPRLVLVAVNLDTFSSRYQVGTSTATLADVMYDAVKRFEPDLVVVDESHKIKSPTSNVSRMLARIGRIAPRRAILSGTVMPAGPLDIYGQWRFLEPFAFGDVEADGTRHPATFDGFRRRYAEMGGYHNQQVMSYKNIDEMQQIMSINAEVARKSDALSLPPTQQTIVRVDLQPAETKAYDEMKKGLATKLTNGLHSSSTNRLSQMMKLRQITSGHIPDDVGTTQVLGDSKAKIIDSLANDTLIGESRIVVFAVFLYEIEMLRVKLARPGTMIMVITGATPIDERKRLRMMFGSDDPGRIIMIAQIRTMSLAVNELVTARHAIFGSLPQTRDDFIQAQDRLDRIGQTRPVTFWFALAPGSIDEVIFNAHKTRTSLEAAVLRHILTSESAEQIEALDVRRQEDEQETQVGRLMDDGTGKLEFAYGTQTEKLDENDPRQAAAAKDHEELQKEAAQAAQIAAW